MLKKLPQYNNDHPGLEGDEASLQAKLVSLHEVITMTFGFVDRVTISAYHPGNDELKTFIAGCPGEYPLKPTSCKLHESPSLLNLMRKGRAAVIKNPNIFSVDAQEQFGCAITSGFPESYAMPVYEQNEFYGFVILNSKQKKVFDEKVLFKMDLFGHMISLMVMPELRVFNEGITGMETLAKKSAKDRIVIAHEKRLTHYARLIKSQLVDRYTINKDMLEQICVYRSIQGSEQMGLSDSLLIKAGCLTEKEYNMMTPNTKLGREMIDHLIDNFSYEGIRRIGILSNVAEFYYYGLCENRSRQVSLERDVPIEAKVVAIADVFDVLSDRFDQQGNAKIFRILNSMVVSELDRDCVSALATSQEQIEDIKICYR